MSDVHVGTLFINYVLPSDLNSYPAPGPPADASVVIDATATLTWMLAPRHESSSMMRVELEYELKSVWVAGLVLFDQFSFSISRYAEAIITSSGNQSY